MFIYKSLKKSIVTLTNNLRKRRHFDKWVLSRLINSLDLVSWLIIFCPEFSLKEVTNIWMVADRILKVAVASDTKSPGRQVPNAVLASICLLFKLKFNQWFYYHKKAVVITKPWISRRNTCTCIGIYNNTNLKRNHFSNSQNKANFKKDYCAEWYTFHKEITSALIKNCLTFLMIAYYVRAIVASITTTYVIKKIFVCRLKGCT